jgi:hypothetical protein
MPRSQPQQSQQIPVPVGEKQSSRQCTARRTCVGMIIMVLISIGGGILLWQLLPSNKRKLVKSTIGDISEGVSINMRDTNATAPPPTYQFMQCSNTSKRCCNGLSTICKMNVSDIMFAGIHNGNAALQNGYRIAPNHIYELESSLDYGYRAISIDIGMCDGVIRLVHGKCKLGTRDPGEVFTNINTWLDANPTEVILLSVEVNNDAGAEEDRNTLRLSDIYDLASSVDGFTDKMWFKGSSERFPTLLEMISSNQRVMFFFYNAMERCRDPNVFCPPGFMDWFASSKEGEFHFTSLADINNTTRSCNATRGRTDGAFFTLNVFVTLPSLTISSETINTKSWLTQHIATCSQMNKNELVNVVYVDFWDQGNLPEVTQLANTARALAIKENRTAWTQNSMIIFNSTADAVAFKKTQS